MILSLLLAFQPAADPLPKPLTEAHKRDIGCIATLGLLADEQRREVEGSTSFPNVIERGRIYAGIVGTRVMAQTNLPREVVGLAINQAVTDQVNIVQDDTASEEKVRQASDTRVSNCLAQLDAEVPVTEKDQAK